MHTYTDRIPDNYEIHNCINWKCIIVHLQEAAARFMNIHEGRAAAVPTVTSTTTESPNNTITVFVNWGPCLIADIDEFWILVPYANYKNVRGILRYIDENVLDVSVYLSGVCILNLAQFQLKSICVFCNFIWRSRSGIRVNTCVRVIGLLYQFRGRLV